MATIVAFRGERGSYNQYASTGFYPVIVAFRGERGSYNPSRVTGTRELVVHHNYILVYDVTGEFVRVLRVLHAPRHQQLKKRP